MATHDHIYAQVRQELRQPDLLIIGRCFPSHGAP
jgi:hypothetical protein